MVQFVPTLSAREIVRPPQSFDYKMVKISPTVFVKHARGNEAALHLERVVNDEAREGWEFFRIEVTFRRSILER